MIKLVKSYGKLSSIFGWFKTRSFPGNLNDMVEERFYSDLFMRSRITALIHLSTILQVDLSSNFFYYIINAKCGRWHFINPKKKKHLICATSKSVVSDKITCNILRKRLLSRCKKVIKIDQLIVRQKIRPYMLLFVHVFTYARRHILSSATPRMYRVTRVCTSGSTGIRHIWLGPTHTHIKYRRRNSGRRGHAHERYRHKDTIFHKTR